MRHFSTWNSPYIKLCWLILNSNIVHQISISYTIQIYCLTQCCNISLKLTLSVLFTDWQFVPDQSRFVLQKPITFVRAETSFWSCCVCSKVVSVKRGWFEKESKYSSDLYRAGFDPSEPQRVVTDMPSRIQLDEDLSSVTIQPEGPRPSAVWLRRRKNCLKQFLYGIPSRKAEGR